MYIVALVSARHEEQNAVAIIGTGELYEATYIPINLDRTWGVADAIYWLRRIEKEHPEDQWVKDRLNALDHP